MNIFKNKRILFSVLAATSSALFLANYHKDKTGDIETKEYSITNSTLESTAPTHYSEADNNLASTNTPSSTQIKNDDAELAEGDEEEDAKIVFEITERDLVISKWDAQHSPPEPNDNNYDAVYKSPFLAEVELYNPDDDCMENCADALQELLPANDEYADQINPDALAKLAILEGTVDQSEQIPLVQPDPSTGPPTDE